MDRHRRDLLRCCHDASKRKRELDVHHREDPVQRRYATALACFACLNARWTLTPSCGCGGGHVLHTAPAVIVYDFACKLYEYCMNRDPAFFMKTQFLVDRFHLNNHNCAASFKVNTYGELAGLNTQVAEQRNSQTAIVQRLFSYMNPRTFLPSLRLVLYNQNLEKIKSLKTT